jgi:tRNA(His) 5'-end guanylyltransferase
VFYITAVELRGGSAHEHIANVQWLNCSTGTAGLQTTEYMVTWLENNPEHLSVAGPDGPAAVAVYPLNGKKYLRTRRDESWMNNLLELPTLT